MDDALSRTMKDALRGVLRAIPGSIHDEDREPERWTRGTPERTCKALRRRGLVDDYWWDPIGGYRARLTDEGLRVRRELRAGTAATRAAVVRLARDEAGT